MNPLKFNFIIGLSIFILFYNTVFASQWDYSEYVPGNDQIQNDECIVHANDEFAILSNADGGLVETDPVEDNGITNNEEFQ